MSDALLIAQFLVLAVTGIITSGIALYFFTRGRQVESSLSRMSTLMAEDGDLQVILTEAREVLPLLTDPEERKELMSSFASELLEIFNFWRMGVKSGENRKLEAVERKLTEVVAEEIVPELVEDPFLGKVLRIVMKNARVQDILQDYDVSLLDLMELAGPLLSNIKLGNAADLSKPGGSTDGAVLWFVPP